MRARLNRASCMPEELRRQDHERLELLRMMLERMGYRIRELQVREEHNSIGSNLPRITIEPEQLGRTGFAGALIAAGDLLAVPENWRAFLLDRRQRNEGSE